MRRRLGYVLVVAGIGVALLTMTVGGSTARACPALDGAVYEAVGVAPGAVELTGLDLTTATVEWYDGCNWRTNSLVPLAFGLLLVLAGVVTAVRTSAN